MWPAIDEIANEYCCPLRMPPSAALMMIAHLLQQGLEPIRMTVDITDYIIPDRHQPQAPMLYEG
jgi:hypothetical protein